MKHRTIASIILVALLVTFLSLSLYGCKPYTEVDADKYPVVDDKENEINKDHTSKDEAIDRTCNAMQNLLDYLDSDVVSNTGYYVGADIVINAENGSAFILKLKANLYTYPYELKDENGNPVLDKNGKPMVDPDKLAIHNRLIKQNDIILEWYDGMTNQMLIGFYYDGINPNSADPGNNLYLNLQGSKRIFPNFGDSVLYQQMVRLITQFNLAAVMGSAAGGTATDAVDTIRQLLDAAVDKNYKQTINEGVTSLYYNDVSLSIVAPDITSYIQSFFGPFEDKLDPLTKKYLGFKFSTLGNTTIESLGSNMQYFVAPASAETLNKEILSGVVVDLINGESTVYDPKTNTRSAVPFTARIAADYSLRTSTNIVIDKKDYKMYKYGSYEYTGDMIIPMLDLKMDALIRTDVNENDNKANRVYSAFRDKADDKLLIGAYYSNEKTYLDISGLQNLYGGIKFEDIGLPKAYKEGFNMAELLKWVFDTIDIYIVYMVDDLLSPSEGSGYDNLTSVIMSKMESTEKTDDDPTSRNTISIRIDIELIRTILKETSTNGTIYSNEQMVDIINDMFNINLNEIANILGVDINDLMDNTEFKITFDVDSSGIKIEVFYHEATMLILDLLPVKIGEEVTIVFPSFKDFKPLLKIMTYSGYLEGQFIFASTEKVDLSTLMGAFIADETGLNTKYILPEAADIYFTMYYDQYIRDQILDNGRWTRAGRSAFNIHFYTVVGNERRDLFRVYANDVCFNTSKSIEEFGYVWVDLICVEGMPKLKVREDLFIESFYRYMGDDVTDGTIITGGLTKIIRALLEDSWPTFEPDVIRITTSNQTIKDFFKVDELIGTISAQIGFKQRVFNIDELEAGFAMYYVGEFSDIKGESPYDIVLHSTIPVYFDYGDRTVMKEMLVAYDKDSIAVINGQIYYYPMLAGRFMGVTRNYTITITGGARGRAEIDALKEDHFVWEPLQSLPTTVVATYGGDSSQTYAYKADYNFFATYNKKLGYYIVQNDYGYDIVYDLKHNTYIVGLGTNFKMNDIYKVLPQNAKIFRKNYTNNKDVEMLYDLKSGNYGYYIVVNERCNIIYNIVKNEYIISSISDMADARIVVNDPDAKIIVVNSLVQIPQGNSVNARYDFHTGYFIIEDPTLQYLFYQTEIDGVLYANFVVNDIATRNKVAAMYPASTVSLNDGSIEWKKVNWEKDGFDAFDLQQKTWDTIDWSHISWEQMTLNGGIYLVKVVIGAGKMATYEQLVQIKVTNREVETDTFVNINTEDGKVKAPVVNPITDIKVDPYAYMLLKADFINNIHGGVLSGDFVQRFFEAYNITIKFTKIYGDSNDTPDEIGNYVWHFDYSNDFAIYSEKDINNFVKEGSESVSYLYTIFKGQVIALAIKIQPRTIDHIQFSGEAEKNTYTVDSLLEETYAIPKYPVVFFKQLDANGEQYKLNFANFGAAESTIFADMLMQPSAKFAQGNVNSGSAFARKSVIQWSNPIADNVKLNWAGQPVKPFKNSQTNVTTSFIDIKNFADPTNSWFNEEWFATPIVSVTVLMPDKVVDNLTFEHNGITYTYSDVIAQAGQDTGVFQIDPYNANGWVLPDTLTVNFNNGVGSDKYQKDYQVEWEMGDHVELKNGAATIKEVSMGERSYFIVKTYIGNDTIGKIEINVLVRNLSGNVTRFEFLDKDNNTLAGDMGKDPYDIQGATTYPYAVDTYSRFAIPQSIMILFDDGSMRLYDTNWETFPVWSQGKTAIVNTTIGNADALSKQVALAFVLEEREIESITFNNANGNIANISYDLRNRTILIKDIIIDKDVVKGTNLNIYEYFHYILGDISVTFVRDSALFGKTVRITDAATSANKTIYEDFDTQKIIAAGQTFTIYMGQGDNADNFAVTVAANGTKIIGGAISKNVVEPYEITDTGAVPKYLDGYNISQNIELDIEYDGTGIRHFPKDFFKDWVVGKPIVDISTLSPELAKDYATDTDSTMNGIAAGDIITVIDWSTLLMGGYCWISTMLPDSSRVFVRLTIGGINIGTKFDSADSYKGKFVIKEGTITINDIYDVFPLNTTLTVDNLPSVIYAQGIEIPGIKWVLGAHITEQFLASINYQTEQIFTLATAKIMDETIVLTMDVRKSEIVGLRHNTDADSTKNFEVVNGGFVFDAYRNSGYEGVFKLPANITYVFGTSVTHKAQNVQYFYFSNRTQGYAPISEIPYDYTGHSLADVNDKGNVRMRITLPDGQIYDFTITFAERTVSHVSVRDYANDYSAGSLKLDPYGAERTVNTKIRVYFTDGTYIAYTVAAWNGEYEVKYDTYRRKLAALNEPYFALTSSLDFAGISSQELNLKVYILDRVVDSWQLESIVADADSASNAADPNATFLYSDPFAGTASMLPGKMINPNINNQQSTVSTVGAVDITDINIKWQFENSDITSEGTMVRDNITGKYGKVVTGYLGSAEYGQPITIRVLISRWEFGGIRRPQGGSYQIMTEDVRFFFTMSTDASAYSNYQIIIKQTVPTKDSLTTSFRNELFFPEDIRIDGLNAGDYQLSEGVKNKFNDREYPYRIKWDNEARVSAKNNIEAKGRFYLSDNNGVTKIYPAGIVTYQYEKPSISQLDFGYGYGTENFAIFVLNPLNPVFNKDSQKPEDRFKSKAKAKGFINQESDKELGEVTITWTREITEIAAITQYLKGGVYRGYRVGVELKTDAYSYKQEFGILLAFIDVSPTDCPSINIGSLLPSSVNSPIKSIYEDSTYNGTVNPYRDAYTPYLITALNAAAAEMELGSKTYDFQNIVWDNPPTSITQDRLVFSKSFVVNNIKYSGSSIVRVLLKLKSPTP